MRDGWDWEGASRVQTESEVEFVRRWRTWRRKAWHDSDGERRGQLEMADAPVWGQIASHHMVTP